MSYYDMVFCPHLNFCINIPEMLRGSETESGNLASITGRKLGTLNPYLSASRT
jgi:hypothetical protein